MQTLEQKEGFVDRAEIVRYIINGIIATIVHYTVLTINMEIFALKSAGVANIIAALFGITVSFLGSRYYVYKGHEGTMIHHAFKFAILYASIALLHGLVLFIWTDHYGLSYHLGFVIATMLQVSLSYVGNKLVVFK